jgi:hypothetical protein
MHFSPLPVSRGHPEPLRHCLSPLFKPSRGSLPRYILGSEQWRVQAVQTGEVAMPSWYRSEKHYSSAGICRLGCTGPPCARVPFRTCAAYICRRRCEFLSGRKGMSQPHSVLRRSRNLSPGLAGSPKHGSAGSHVIVCCLAERAIFPVDSPARYPRCPLPLPEPSFQTIQRVPPQVHSRVRTVAGPGSANRGSGNVQLIPLRKALFLCWDLPPTPRLKDRMLRGRDEASRMAETKNSSARPLISNGV